MKVITYSLDEKLSKIETLCVKSWINNGYEVDIYTYSKNLTNLKVNIKNAEKLIKLEEMEKIIIPIIKKFFFKIKLGYLLGGVIIDPDVYCLKFYDFKEESIVSCTPSPNYLESFPDLSLFKFPKRSKELQYIVHHFFMLYNDVINGYNTEHNICEILVKLINKVFKLNKMNWKYTHSCNEDHWKLQLGIPFDITKLRSFGDGIKDYILDPKDLHYFLKVWQEDINYNIKNFDLKNYPQSILGKVLR